MADEQQQNWLSRPTTQSQDRSKFLLGRSSNLGRATQEDQERSYRMFSSQEDPNYPESERREEPESSEDEDKLEKEIAYTIGGGATSLRDIGQSFQNVYRGGTRAAITEGFKIGRQFRGTVGQSKFNDALLIGLALTKDSLDMIIQLITLGAFLGLLAASFGLFLTVIIITVRMFRGGAISRFIFKWMIIFLIDTLIGTFVTFIPVATIGMMLLVRQERKKAEKEAQG